MDNLLTHFVQIGQQVAYIHVELGSNMTFGVYTCGGKSQGDTQRQIDLLTEKTHEGSLPQRSKNCGALHHRNKSPECLSNVCVLLCCYA